MVLKVIGTAAAVFILATAPAGAADGAATPADACPGGRTEIVRTSKITPKGSLEGFMKAAADHEAWFKAHGYTADRFAVARIIKRDKEKKTFGFSDTEVVTVHMNPTYVPPDKQDDAYKAFVKAYRDNSEIETEMMLCVGQPKEPRPASP